MKLLKATLYTNPGSWSREVKCKNCDALLLVEEDDLKQRWSAINYNRKKANHYVYVYDCPNCKEENTMHSRFVPKPVRNRINKPQ
jgi:ribosomal protein S27E